MRFFIACFVFAMFVISYNLFLIVAIKGLFLNEFYMKGWYTSSLLFYIVPTLLIGISNDKSSNEIKVMGMGAFYLLLILGLTASNHFGWLLNGNQARLIIVNSLTLVFVIAMAYTEKRYK